MQSRPSGPRDRTVQLEAIRQRVIDARVLWTSGRREGAFILALIAVAATARQRYPDVKGDRKAFETFLLSDTNWPFSRIGSVEYHGQQIPFAGLFYKVLRCQLVHEGNIPIDVEFMMDLPDQALALRAGGAPAFILQLSPGWFHALVQCVEVTWPARP